MRLLNTLSGMSFTRHLHANRSVSDQSVLIHDLMQTLSPGLLPFANCLSPFHSWLPQSSLPKIRCDYNIRTINHSTVSPPLFSLWLGSGWREITRCCWSWIQPAAAQWGARRHGYWRWSADSNRDRWWWISCSCWVQIWAHRRGTFGHIQQCFMMQSFTACICIVSLHVLNGAIIVFLAKKTLAST